MHYELFKGEKHKPYKQSQAMTELSKAMDMVRSAVYKIKPLKGMASDAYKKFSVGVKARIKNMKGPYAYSYPTGHYDFLYEPDVVRAPSEPEGVYVAAPSERGDVYVMPPSDLVANASEPEPSVKKDRTEKHTFGYKVTIYRTPVDKGNQ